MKKRWYLWETAGLLAADQIMKAYAERDLQYEDEKVLFDKLVLRYVRNKGMCLNLLENRPELVLILSGSAAGIVACVQAAALLGKKSAVKRHALSLLAAGACSNTADRLFRGYVVDYMGLKSGNKKLSAVTYNLADFLIAAGTAALSADSINKQLRIKISR